MTIKKKRPAVVEPSRTRGVSLVMPRAEHELYRRAAEVMAERARAVGFTRARFGGVGTFIRQAAEDKARELLGDEAERIWPRGRA